MEGKGFRIEIYREKSIEDLTKILSDPAEKVDSGSSAAAVSALGASLLCRAARLAKQMGDENERLDWLVRNTDILRNYFVRLIDEDVKCRGPLRRAEREGDVLKIAAARQTAISICTEIINMNGKSLELAEELVSLSDPFIFPYLQQGVELTLASSQVCVSYCLKMSSLSQDETYRYVIRRENELTMQAMKETADRIQASLLEK